MLASQTKHRSQSSSSFVQTEEIPSFPLVDVPDAELDPEQIKEKKRQRMLKANYDTRVKLKAEKQAERDRLVGGSER